MPGRYGQGAGGKGGGRGRCRRGRDVNASQGGYGSDDGYAGFCVCSRCGFRQPHERGVPCNEKKCPSCGAQMIRED